MADGPTFAPAFAPGDPRGALYWKTVGEINHGFESTNTELTKGEEDAKAKATYQEGQYTKQEPEVYQNNAARAIAGGFQESGINANRRGKIATGFLTKRYGNTQGLKTSLDTYAKTRNKAEEDRNQKVNTLNWNALGTGEKELQGGPLETPSVPQTQGVNYAATEKPGTWQGGVRIGAPAKPIKWSRDAATRRLQAQRGY